MRNINSILKLDKMVFDKIEFQRLGFKNDNELEFELQSNIAQKQGTETYKSTLILKGKKPEEYIFEISLTGFFSIEPDEELTEEIKNTLISKNTIAILMPYLRSEVSILTAQPEIECVVLPPFNVNSMFDEK